MDIYDIRDVVANAYKSPGWKNKVYRMSESQIIAIYYNLSSKPPKRMKSKPANTKKDISNDSFEQLSLFELFEKEN